MCLLFLYFYIFYEVVYEIILFMCCCLFFFFFKQKTAYEMRISDWSSDVCSSDLAEQLAQEYMASICAPYSVGIHQFTLSASIGIALYDGGSVSGSQLMTRADTAMYQAKREGGSRICFFDDLSSAMIANPSRL